MDVPGPYFERGSGRRAHDRFSARFVTHLSPASGMLAGRRALSACDEQGAKTRR